MSLSGNDSDCEVERIMKERPPSSYGSMKSDDHEEDDVEFEDDPPTTTKVSLQPPSGPAGIKLYRPDSPETGITSVTQGQQSIIHKEGAFLNVTGYFCRHTHIEGESFTKLTCKPQQQSTMETEEEYEPHKERQRGEEIVLRITVTPPPQPEEAPPPPPEGVGLQSGVVHSSLSLSHIFKAIQQSLSMLKPAELIWFKRSLCSQYKEHFKYSEMQESDVLDVVDRMLERQEKGPAVHIAVRTLNDINKREIADALATACGRALLQYEMKQGHTRRYYNLYEGTCRPGQQRFVGHVYVEPPIFIGGDRDINTDHEFHQPNFPGVQGTPIRANDIFRLQEGETRVRTVLMTGVPGIGLTVAVQKFIMDWTNNHANQDFQFVFALPGRELHLVKDSEETFLEMLSSFHPEAKKADFLNCEDCKILFIIDALELSKQPLDFKNNQVITDFTLRAPTDALLTSLIKGSLLPHANIWITCHRAASRIIPPECIDRFADLKGFTDAQKDEYFTKRTKDRELGNRVLAHIKRSSALYNMCQLPLLCWMVACVYEQRLRNLEQNEHTPTITAFYTQYIIVQTNRKIERYVGLGLEASLWRDADKGFLAKMGKLALKLVLEERDVFYEDEVSSYELNLEDVTNRGGISTEVMREGGYPRGRGFSFVHYSLQEFMAAMYTYVRFRTQGKNEFDKHLKDKVASKVLKDRSVLDLYKPIVDRALASRNGHLDMFLRFLFGFVTPGTEHHLRGHFMPQYHPQPKGMDDVVKYVQKKIKENASPERCNNLLHCLAELEEGKTLR